MKKLFTFVLIIIGILAYPSAVKAESLLSLVYSGVEYSAAEAAEKDSGLPYTVEDTGNALQITDGATGVKAEITHQALDENAFDVLRDYYNDSSLSDRELYDKFIELKKSYVNALQTLYNTNYINDGKMSPETAMQIYYEGAETLFGQEGSTVNLYNIARYEGLYNDEQTHLDLILPVRSNYSVITIKFTIPRSKLVTAASGSIADMLSGIRFDGLSEQLKPPSVLNDKALLEKAQQGIFPASQQKHPTYVQMTNLTAGFSLSLPESYIPFVQNNLGGVFSYESYKINPNQIFSVSSEPLRGNGAEDAIIRFKAAAPSSLKVLESGSRLLGGNFYTYLNYSIDENGVRQYFYNYYVQNESRLYKLQLQSAIAEPGEIVAEQFERILIEFSLQVSAADPSGQDKQDVKDLQAAQNVQSEQPATVKYLNSDEGYSFKYPKDWQLEDVSRDIAYDRLRLVLPGLSGALEVTVQESELKHIVTFNDIKKSVNSKSAISWPDLAINYNPPFADKTSKLLISDYSVEGAVSTVYRLSAFIDENGRNRLCYSVDIIKGRKVYSMFITAGEYRTVSGRFINEQVNELVNTVASSFRLESTPDTEARRISGETRNRKLVFVEDYLKQLIDPNLVITSVQEIQPDKTFFVTVGNTGESGFYKIRLDYPKRQVEVVESVLKRNILHNEIARLKQEHRGKIITSAVQNEGNMTIMISSRENMISARVSRTYRVDVSFAGGKVTWKSVRLAHQEDYMWECSLYVQSLLTPDTGVYFADPSVFKNLETYRQKNLKYPLLTYVQSAGTAGFLTLSMDPATSLYSADSGIIPLQQVIDSVRVRYGIGKTNSPNGMYSFDPASFTLSLFTGGSIDNEADTLKFKILYNVEKGRLDFEKIN